MPAKTFDADGWSIEIMLHGGFNKDVPPERMIATAMGDVRSIKPHEEIRDAVQFKGGRYGAMTVPYLIVVADCKEELQGGRVGDAALEAMFGTVVTEVWADENGKPVTRDRRAADGYWGTPDAPKHRDVSGILASSPQATSVGLKERALATGRLAQSMGGAASSRRHSSASQLRT